MTEHADTPGGNRSRPTASCWPVPTRRSSTISLILATLPATARGQVFAEVGSDHDITVLDAPGRVMVCWLVRDRGQALQRSVDAWLSEMLPDSGLTESSVYAWIATDGPARLITSD